MACRRETGEARKREEEEEQKRNEEKPGKWPSQYKRRNRLTVTYNFVCGVGWRREKRNEEKKKGFSDKMDLMVDG